MSDLVTRLNECTLLLCGGGPTNALAHHLVDEIIDIKSSMLADHKIYAGVIAHCEKSLCEFIIVTPGMQDAKIKLAQCISLSPVVVMRCVSKLGAREFTQALVDSYCSQYLNELSDPITDIIHLLERLYVQDMDNGCAQVLDRLLDCEDRFAGVDIARVITKVIDLVLNGSQPSNALCDWLNKNTQKLADSGLLVEMGCFDGRSTKPSMKIGFDMCDVGLVELGRHYLRHEYSGACGDDFIRRHRDLGIAVSKDEVHRSAIMSKDTHVALLAYYLWAPETDLSIERLPLHKLGLFEMGAACEAVVGHGQISDLKLRAMIINVLKQTHSNVVQIIDYYMHPNANTISDLACEMLEVALVRKANDTDAVDKMLGLAERRGLVVQDTLARVRSSLESGLAAQVKAAPESLITFFKRDLGKRAESVYSRQMLIDLINSTVNDLKLVSLRALNTVLPDGFVKEVPVMRRMRMEDDFGL